MPIRSTANAPKFDGTTDNLAEFINAYEQLADEAGLQGLDCIKGIIRYLARDDRELWGGMPEAAVDDYDAFMAEVKILAALTSPIGSNALASQVTQTRQRATLQLLQIQSGASFVPHCIVVSTADLRAIAREYTNKLMPSCTELSNYLRAFRKVMQPLIDEDHIGKVEHDHLFMEGIPSDAQAQIRLRLMIKFPDHHPYDPYPFMDVFAAAQFLLPARAFPTPSAPVSTPVSAPVAKCKDRYHASRAMQDTTTSASVAAGLFYCTPSDVVLDRKPPVPILAPPARAFPAPSRESRAPQPSTAPACKAIPERTALDHELERVLVKRNQKRTAGASSPSSSAPSPSQSTASSSSFTLSEVRDDSKHLLHTNAPVETRASIAIASRAPIAITLPEVRDDSKHLLHTNAPLETRAPIAIALPVVRDDSKHLLHSNAPIVDVIMPSLRPRSPIASLKEEVLPIAPSPSPLSPSASSEVRDDPKHLLHLSAPKEELSAASEAQATPRINQSLSLEIPYVTNDHAHVALFASSDYCMPVKHPCIMLPNHQAENVSGDPGATQAHHIAPEDAQCVRLEALRDLGVRLTHTYTPNPPIIIFNFAISTIIRILRAFAYHVNFVPARPDAHYSPSPMRLLCLDIPPLQPICATFAPNSTLYTSRANTFAGKWPFLACSANIIKFARHCPKARTSRASHQLVERPYTPCSASHWRTFNLQRTVQEFILPVTSPPQARQPCAFQPTLGKASARKRCEAPRLAGLGLDMDWIALRPRHFTSHARTHTGLQEHCPTAHGVPTAYNTCDTHALSRALRAHTFSRFTLYACTPPTPCAPHPYHSRIIASHPWNTIHTRATLAIYHAMLHSRAFMPSTRTFSRLAQLPALHTYHSYARAFIAQQPKHHTSIALAYSHAKSSPHTR
ncbi:hypothetical protein C8R48DRAFT_769707 [Suillus tomentosus]|nr:hypothetical protein C8R48DRAFT_769707 [Suillus tomentosus]